MGRHRDRLGLAWIYVWGERHERVTQLLDRSFVSRPKRIYANAERNDENNHSDHVSKTAKVEAQLHQNHR